MGACNYQQIKEIFGKIDTDKSGSIDYSEFLSAAINKKNLLRKKELKAAFKHIDRDGSGDISKKELRKAFQSRGTKTSEQEWDLILSQIDDDRNDRIDIQEFVRIMEKVINPDLKTIIQEGLDEDKATPVAGATSEAKIENGTETDKPEAENGNGAQQDDANGQS